MILKKGNSGRKRDGDGSTFKISDNNSSDIAGMLKNGEIPAKITGTKSERAKIFEEIDRLYPNPSGIMSEYHVNDTLGTASIHFDNNAIRGEDILVRYPNGSKATASEKSGAIKYAIYRNRGALELAALCRRGGFATYEMAQKYGGRLLSNTEKSAVNREMNAHIKKLFGSPISREGREANETHWIKEPGGWRRSL